MCSCIEADIARGNDGRICTIPVVPAQQPLYDPWSNPYSQPGHDKHLTSPSKRSFLFVADVSLHTFRISKCNFCTVDTYKSPGIRNALARYIMRLLRR